MRIALTRSCLLWLLAAMLFGGRAVALAPSPEASGESASTRVVLVSAAEIESLASRFAAELTSLHFEVLRLPDGESAPSTNELEALAVELHARATVRVVAVEGGLDLWLVNPATHEVIYRRIAAERDPAVAVLRSLELLRGSLIDLRALEKQPEKPEPTPAPALARPKPRPVPSDRLWLGLGASLTSLDARSSFAWGALGSLRYRAYGGLWLRADAWVPLDEWAVEGQSGTAYAWWGGLALGAAIAPFGERLITPMFGAGVAGLGFHTRGEVQAGFRASSDLRPLALPHADFSAFWRMSPHVGVRAQLLGGWALPRPVLLLAEERQSDFINPVVQGALAVEVLLD
jgi:hypothetical protein